jgi:trehalose synthase
MLHALGVEADWRLIHGQAEFFTVTKAFHNALQGAEYDLQGPEQRLYLRVNEESAAQLAGDYDVFIVHDPQPAAIRHFAGGRGAQWIWRCHIDTSAPSEAVSRFLRPFLAQYDAAIFTMAEFLLPELQAKRIAFIAPAIDPLATKNLEVPLDLCRRAIAESGVDVARPLLVQVSRFDPWKDPLGVIRAYRLVKAKVPGVQLALIGAMAADDPEGWELLDRVEEVAADDADLFVFTNVGGSAAWRSTSFNGAATSSSRSRCAKGSGWWSRKPSGRSAQWWPVAPAAFRCNVRRGSSAIWWTTWRAAPSRCCTCWSIPASAARLGAPAASMCGSTSCCRGWCATSCT